MAVVLVLVRGVNVGRGKLVGMADLSAALEAAGGVGVRTYLRSGNAVTDVPASAAASPGSRRRLAAACETALAERTGVSARVLVVTPEELHAVVSANPFPDLAATPQQLHVLFCETRPEPDPTGLGLVHGADELAVGDRVVYVAYRSGRSSDSPLGKVLPKIPVVTTARNWSTVLALQEMVDSARSAS